MPIANGRAAAAGDAPQPPQFGLVFPGLGWVMWRSRDYLPESLVFHDNYLGKDQITITLNFSKGEQRAPRSPVLLARAPVLQRCRALPPGP